MLLLLVFSTGFFVMFWNDKNLLCDSINMLKVKFLFLWLKINKFFFIIYEWVNLFMSIIIISLKIIFYIYLNYGSNKKGNLKVGSYGWVDVNIIK